MILSPVTPSIAPHLDSRNTVLETYLSDIYTVGVNLAGLPSISVPVELEPMPIGMQFIGNRLDEQTILDVAMGLEKELLIKEV